MKQTTTSTTLLLCAAVLSRSSCATASKSPAGKHGKPSAGTSAGVDAGRHGDAVKVEQQSSSPHPRGKWEPTEDGGILTLPNGQKFVSQTSLERGQVRLTFPNGQKFVSETAKIDPNPPFVSADGTLVAIERAPATKTGDLHIYIKEGARRFREVPHVNEQINKLFKGVKGAGAKGAGGGEVLRLRALSDHTLTLWSIAYHPPGFEKHQFKVKVARNGSLSLVK